MGLSTLNIGNYGSCRVFTINLSITTVVLHQWSSGGTEVRVELFRKKGSGLRPYAFL